VTGLATAATINLNRCEAAADLGYIIGHHPVVVEDVPSVDLTSVGSVRMAFERVSV
jgi:hypothetical protein